MQRQQSAPLSEESKAKAQEIIGQYDPQTMTDDDTKAMRTELREAGITPSREFKGILEDSGFEVKGPKAGGGKGHGGPPPPPPSGTDNAEYSTEIADFLAKYETNDVTEDDLANLVEILRQSGQDASGLVIDENA